MFSQLFPPFKVQHVPHQEGTAILEVVNLRADYNGHPALEGVSFQLNVGERVAVVGPNGAGKSTLFKVVAGVMSASEGVVKVFGHGPSGHICIAYLPQRNQVDWNFPVSVKDVVMMGRVGKIGVFRWPKKRDWDYVHQCLELVGLVEMAGRQIRELSGGQQQRMFIARALAQEAELMLMDEPFAGLDTPSQEGILQILQELHRRGVTVMVAIHDLNLASEQFDRVILLNRRLLGFGPAEEVITAELLMEAYGGHLRMIRTEQGLVMLEHTCGDHDVEGSPHV